MYDIVIIGGGISGAVLGKFLKQDYKVLILEKRNYEDDKNKYIKSCGGLLAHEAQASLSKLGYCLPKEALVTPQVFYVKVFDLDNNIEKFYYKNYINLDRENFDNFLLSEVRKGVDIKKDVLYKKYTEIEKGYSVEFIENGEVKKVEAKIIIGADGANSLIRKSLYMKELDKQYLTIQRIYKFDKKISYHGAIFDSEINDFYSWFIPKEGKLILGTALKKEKNAKAKLDKLERKMIEKGFDLSNPLYDEGTFINKPKIGEFYPGKGDVLLVGEAAGLISPSSSEGISFAIRSGYLLAMALNESLTDFRKPYIKSLLKIRISISLKNIKAGLMYNKAIRKWIIKCGLFSSKQHS